MIAPIARPVFVWAHGRVMARGARGLASFQGARLISATCAIQVTVELDEARRRVYRDHPQGLRAVTSISIFMRGSDSPVTSMVAAGAASPKYSRSAGQQSSKSAVSGR